MKNLNDSKIKKEKNIHEGHRARLVELARNAGLDNLSDIQVMEFFLTYIFPRGDMNPLAHRLIDEYETFTAVIDADAQDLMRIKGINERSAKMINMFSELFYYYATARMGKKFKVESMSDILDVVEDHLRFRNTENMLLLAISSGNIVTQKRRINLHSSGQVSVNLIELSSFITSAKPSSLVVAHCHPYGYASASKADVESYKQILKLCDSMGVFFVDSLILGEEGVYSQKHNTLLRKYVDVEELKESFKTYAS